MPKTVICRDVNGNECEVPVDGFDEHEKQYAELAEWYPLSALDTVEIAGTHDWRPVVRKITAC
jgi:hypothetical protein